MGAGHTYIVLAFLSSRIGSKVPMSEWVWRHGEFMVASSAASSSGEVQRPCLAEQELARTKLLGLASANTGIVTLPASVPDPSLQATKPRAKKQLRKEEACFDLGAAVGRFLMDRGVAYRNSLSRHSKEKRLIRGAKPCVYSCKFEAIVDLVMRNSWPFSCGTCMSMLHDAGLTPDSMVGMGAGIKKKLDEKV